MRRKTNLKKKKSNDKSTRKILGVLFPLLGAFAILLPLAFLSKAMQAPYIIGATIGVIIDNFVVSLLECLEDESKN